VDPSLIRNLLGVLKPSLFESVESNRYMALETNNDGEIIGFNKTTHQEKKISNGGVYLVKVQALKNLELTYQNQSISLEADILPLALLKEQIIYSYIISGRFLDIGLPSDYFRSSQFLQEI
jgi:D-glycero-alpha-D-manno-heptose 1-phosphate guanylyltransferase